MEGRFISSVSFLTFLVASCTDVACSVCVVDGWWAASVIMSFPPLDMAVVLKAVGGVEEVADSGDEEADVSETKGESNVEPAVVGEDSVDSENKDGTLPRWLKGLLCCCGSWVVAACVVMKGNAF